MPTFEVYDTVVVRNDRSLVGTVERTHHLAEADSLEEYLILRHVAVSLPALTEFVTTGVPPLGFVFVSCLDDERGSFLAHEDDLLLLCRSFDLGDRVKRDDGVTGTVTDVSDAYSIQPIWVADEKISLAPSLPVEHLQDCASKDSEECPYIVISQVPGQELTHKQAVFEDDLVCYKEWLGVVQEVDVDVVLQFEDDSIVVLDSPNDLHIPVPDPGSPLVSLPELDSIPRPDFLSAFQGYSWVIPTKYPRPGTIVLTSRNTLRGGRWIHGKYTAGGTCKGMVLDLVPRQLVIQWLSCNPFAPLKAGQVIRPDPIQNLYANHSTYSTGTSLRQNPNLAIIDLLSPPRGESPRAAEIVTDRDSQGSSTSHEVRPASLHQDLRVGDCVRFRDPTAAAVKYQGGRGTPHGRFTRISPESTHGWDLNIFKVIAKEQTVQVLWQDGKTIHHNANEIQRFSGFEPDFAPTDIVVNRAGMKQVCEGGNTCGSSPLRDFNEMTFFESPHSLYPVKVGVIQSVDARERVAKVRWFQNPKVVLLENGNRRSAGSCLGPIGDTIEEVSLYEVMAFPAFDRRLRDVALLPPSHLSKRTMEIIHSAEEVESNHAQILSRYTMEARRLFSAVRDVVRLRGLLKPETISSHNNSKPTQSGIDWLGEIINTGLDGSLTVRLSGARPCRDVKVTFDEIMAVIHLDYVDGVDDDDDASMDEYDSLDEFEEESVSTISETVEYEGGERIDNDSGDDNWVSADEDEQDESGSSAQDTQDGDAVMLDASSDNNAPLPSNQEIEPSATRPSLTPSFSNLHSRLPSSAPPPFDILSIDPPLDQYQPSSATDPPNSSFFLKRIRQEHKVLASSLPAGQIYVRTYESRLDLFRCLIIGPPDTPYEHAPFLIDLHLPPQFPDVPPTAHFHSWTSGLGRINPNLYEEGKICLSLLGTWPGKESGEGWSKSATILQLLVSLQGLVFVPKPFYNEAGFENEEANGGYKNESAMYSEKAFVIARGFVGYALTRPPVGMEDVLAWVYLPVFDEGGDLKDPDDERLLVKVVARVLTLIEASQIARDKAAAEGSQEAEVVVMDGTGNVGDETKAFLRPLSKGAVVMLRRQLEELNMFLSRWWTLLKRQREAEEARRSVEG